MPSSEEEFEEEFEAAEEENGDSELDSDEETAAEIVLNAEKYLAVLHSLLLSPITGPPFLPLPPISPPVTFPPPHPSIAGPPFSPPIQRQQFTANDESPLLPLLCLPSSPPPLPTTTPTMSTMAMMHHQSQQQHSKGSTTMENLQREGESEEGKIEKMSFGSSSLPTCPNNIILSPAMAAGRAPPPPLLPPLPSKATPLAKASEGNGENGEGKMEDASSPHSFPLPTTSSNIISIGPHQTTKSSHQQQQSKGGTSAAAPFSPHSLHSSPHSLPFSSSSTQQPYSPTSSFPSFPSELAKPLKPNPLGNPFGNSPGNPSEQQPIVVIRQQQQQRPAIPPKPQLDVVRFSMAQARDELDLDTILTELLELESQLMSGEIGDQLVLGLPTLLPSASQKTTAPAGPSEMPPPRMAASPPSSSICCTAAPIEQMAKRVQFQQFAAVSSTGTSQTDSALPSTARLPSNAMDFCCVSPDADSAFGDSSSTESAHPPIPLNSNGGGLLNGTNGRNGGGGGSGGRGSEFSSADSFRGSLNTTPSPTNHQQANGNLLVGQNGGGMPPPPGNRPPSSADSFVSTVSKDEAKKAKIREALEKMKEAKMKKVFVKIFLEDGSQRGLLLDERWTAAETMRQLADKIGCLLSAEHAIVEEYPHLHIKRAYEDHELVVENLEEWTADSPNKLHFLRLPQKWTLFRQPQLFLLTDRNRAEFPPQQGQWDGTERARLLEEYLRQEDGGGGGMAAAATNRVPELEGWLLLKADGKKSWRRHFFVLRASGLYYVAKPGKPRGPTRDLSCLMSVFNNQVYICTDWRKKYKAPSDWGFAIKHPRIQVKTSKYIKYICAEDEATFLQWITALRIIKNGCPILYKNFCAATQSSASASASTQNHAHPLHHHSSTSTLASSTTAAGPSTPAIRVQIPQVPLQRLSAALGGDPAALFPLGQSQSPRHQKVLFAQQNGGTASIVGSPAMSRASFAAMPSSSSARSNGGEFQRPQLVDSPIHVSFAFDQDQCNTIKRQPDSLTNGTANFPAPTLRHFDGTYGGGGGRLGTPTTSSTSTILMENGGGGAESDSDEEQFPPPPSNETTPTNGGGIFQHAESPRRIIATGAPQCPPKPSTLSLSNSPWKMPSASNASEFATPPPPPPKRAEGTRIQSIGPNGGGYLDEFAGNGGGQNVGPPRNVQMLMAELQLATNKQKMRLEQNL